MGSLGRGLEEDISIKGSAHWQMLGQARTSPIGVSCYSFCSSNNYLALQSGEIFGKRIFQLPTLLANLVTKLGIRLNK